MIMKQVIDTNVILVANGKHSDASPACQIECIQQLHVAKKSVTVVDSQYRILGEYLNKTRPNQPKGPGDVFLKWLLQNTANKKHVETVDITEQRSESFVEFPDQSLQAEFDAADRKFVAVANKHPDKPTILEAVACKWLPVVATIIPSRYQSRVFKQKFPNEVVPPLPKL
jgi:hypothetical protein